MILWINTRTYCGASAVEIVRRMERDDLHYPHKGQTVRDYISWSLGRLDDKLPLNELAISDRVSEETIALSYLCLLDQYGMGELHCLPDSANADQASFRQST